MKKVILAIGFIALFTACSSPATEETAVTTDSTTVDTTMVADTTVAQDSAKAEVDSTK